MSKKRKKELLLIVPRLDLKDSILAFLYFWVEEFVKQADKVTVIALKGSEEEKRKIEKAEGKVYLLNNISKPLKLLKIAQIMFKEKRNYSSVLSFMYPELAIVSGFTGMLLGKRRGMWYTHGKVSVRLLLAVFFNELVFTASYRSMRVRTKKKRVVGHGIVTDLFNPNIKKAKEKNKFIVLSVGRISRSKRFEVIIDAIDMMKRRDVYLWIVGPVVDREYFNELKGIIERKKLEHRVLFLGEVNYLDMPKIYASADVFVSASETGSLDKVVLEAMFMDLPLIIKNKETFITLKDKNSVFLFNSVLELYGIISQLLHEKKMTKMREENKVRNKSYDNTVKDLIYEILTFL